MTGRGAIAPAASATASPETMTLGQSYAMFLSANDKKGAKSIYQMQHWEYVICDFKPDNVYDDWTITVTDAAGK